MLNHHLSCMLGRKYSIFGSTSMTYLLLKLTCKTFGDAWCTARRQRWRRALLTKCFPDCHKICRVLSSIATFPHTPCTTAPAYEAQSVPQDSRPEPFPDLIILQAFFGLMTICYLLQGVGYPCTGGMLCPTSRTTQMLAAYIPVESAPQMRCNTCGVSQVQRPRDVPQNLLFPISPCLWLS